MPKALITGAGKRLGRAMALYLAERGHDVALHYATSAAAAEDVAEQARALGVRAVTLHADLLDEAATAALIPAAARALEGPLTVLINNASIFDHDTINAYAPELVQDLPAGGTRLLQRSSGYAATIKRGTPTVENGELTGEYPGSLMRGPQAR